MHMKTEALFTSFNHRCELVLDVTLDTIRSDPELRLCEGLRLIEATRKAIRRFDPTSLDIFERTVVPFLRETLMDRFGVVEPFPDADHRN